MIGNAVVELNPAGPDQEQLTPLLFVALSNKLEPAHNGLLAIAVTTFNAAPTSTCTLAL
jgi:hypothetical protein